MGDGGRGGQRPPLGADADWPHRPATAQVVEVQGRSVLFAVEAHDGDRKIAEGMHRRGAVNLQSFAKRYGL